MSLLEFIKGSQLTTRDTADNGDYIFVISGGTTYKMLRSVFLAGISGGSQDLDDVLNEGSTASISTDYEVEREGTFYGFGLLITTEYPSGFFMSPTFYITDKNSVVICLNFDVNGFARYEYDNNTTPTNYSDLLEIRFIDPVSGYYNRLARNPALTQNFSVLFPIDEDGGSDKTMATREWTANLIEGLKTKQPVRLATTANITLSGLAMIDGETPQVGDRILVKDQTSIWLNGIYIASESTWVRAADANTSSELTNAVVTVLEGTANAQSTYRQINTDLVLESSAVIWQSFGSSVADATASTKGKMKLFNDLLNSYTDGSVTQAAIVAALASKANKRTLVSLSSNKSLTNTTSLQALFDDDFDVEAGEYTFFIEASLASLAASGAIFFGTLGTAGVTSINWVSNGNKQASFPTTNQIQVGSVTTAVQICGSSTGTNGVMVVTGRIVFSDSGTFIPAVGFTAAPSSGIVNAGSSGSIIKID